MKKFTWIITLAIVLLGCTNEYAVKIPVGSNGQLAESEDFKAVVEELPMVDKEALAAYLIRASMTAAMTTMPLQQVTIGEAIAAQRKFEAEQKAVADAAVLRSLSELQILEGAAMVNQVSRTLIGRIHKFYCGESAE